MTDIAGGVSDRELRACWFHSPRNVFVTEGGHGDGLEQWSNAVFQPGFTFTHLEGRASPFPDPDDSARLCAFAQSVSDDALLAQYVLYGWEDHGDPERTVAGLFLSPSTWDAMRTATVGYAAPPTAEPEPALSFAYGFSDASV